MDQSNITEIYELKFIERCNKITQSSIKRPMCFMKDVVSVFSIISYFSIKKIPNPRQEEGIWVNNVSPKRTF